MGMTGGSLSGVNMDRTRQWLEGAKVATGLRAWEVRGQSGPYGQAALGVSWEYSGAAIK